MYNTSIENKYYWSRIPSKFVNKNTGEEFKSQFMPKFRGTVREWYETLVEVTIDMRNVLTGRASGANCEVFAGEDVFMIYECSLLAHPLKDRRALNIAGMIVSVDRRLPNNVIVVKYQGQTGEIVVLDMPRGGGE